MLSYLVIIFSVKFLFHFAYVYTELKYRTVPVAPNTNFPNYVYGPRFFMIDLYDPGFFSERKTTYQFYFYFEKECNFIIHQVPESR